MLIRRKDEAAWRSPAVTNYTDEAALEGLLAESPQELLGTSEPVAAVPNSEYRRWVRWTLWQSASPGR